MSEAFLSLIDLQNRILAAQRPVEVAFLAVDMTHALIPYRQAALWNGTDVVALSGVANVDANSPYVLWLGQVFRHLSDKTEATPLTAAHLPPNLAGQWADWLPPMLCCFPWAARCCFMPVTQPLASKTRHCSAI